MIRGTTPTLEFVLPFDTSLLAEAFVTLAQGGTVVVDKSLKDCNCSGDLLTVRLTQEDTLKLDDKINTEIQIRAKTVSGDAIASNITTVDTERILKDGVI
jgi:hypothetical protein